MYISERFRAESCSTYLILVSGHDLCSLAGPGDSGLGIALDLALEHGIAALGKASISEDLLEHWW